MIFRGYFEKLSDGITREDQQSELSAKIPNDKEQKSYNYKKNDEFLPKTYCKDI